MVLPGQAMLWGEAATPGVILAKVATDMLVWVPLWALPMTVAAYQWMNRRLTGRAMTRRVEVRVNGDVAPPGGSDPGHDRGRSSLGVGVGEGGRLSGTERFRRWYLRDVVPVMVSNWAVWLPAVFVIYVLPTPLQLPMQNVVLCFWSLVLVFQVRNV